ncbi:MAG: extracellular solute-binding protein [Clostridiales bacterium]|nr:extracellular solute-binding protein [Clostridiales bacterium]
MNKRILALALSAAMLLPMASLSACKKSASGSDAGGANGNGGNGSNGGQSAPMAGPTTPDGSEHGDYILETDTYYSAEEWHFAIPEKEGRQPDVTEIYKAFFNDQNMVFAYQRSYKLTEAEQEEIRHLDFNDPEQLDRYYDLQEQQNESGFMVTTLSGDMIMNVDLRAYSCLGIFQMTDGRYGAVVERMNRDMNSFAHNIFIEIINEKGEVVSDTPINPLIADMYNIEMMAMPDGNYLFYGNSRSDGYAAWVLDQEFNPLKKLDGDGVIYRMNGKYYRVKFFDWDPIASEESGYICRELDVSSWTLSAEQPLAPNVPDEFYLYPDGDKVFTDDGEGLCSIDLLTGEKERLLLWGDTDVYINRIDAMKAVSSEDIYIFQLKDATMIHLKKEATNPHAGKRIIRVGVNNIDYYYYRQIAEYNKRPESLARVYVYYPNSDRTITDLADKATAADKLLLDMRSGDGPDILINYSEFGQFDNDTVLVDLNPYIDGNQGIDRSLYYDNVFRAFETDGKLYQLPLTVLPSGIVGNPDLLGEISGWTCDEYLQKINGLPDGVFPILFNSTEAYPEEPDGLGILLNLLYCDMGHYVDYGSYEVRFDSDDFRKLLEIAKRSDSHLTSETLEGMKSRYGEMTRTEPIFLMVQDGLCACSTLHIRSLYDVSVMAGLCHNHPLLIGFPTSENPGLAAEAITTIGISAFSEAPDEAWDFVKFFVSPEAQNAIFKYYDSWGFSICKESQKLAIQHEIDALGGMQDQGTINQSVVDTYERLIGSITHRIMKNPSIVEIIKEEAPAYFEGDKTAEEVSKTIQDRASRVLQELE